MGYSEDAVQIYLIKNTLVESAANFSIDFIQNPL